MIRPIALALLVCSVLGCGPEVFVRGPYFDVTTPQRIAVLPFVDRTGHETITSEPFTAVVDALPLVGRGLSRGPSTMLRNRFTVNPYRSNLDVVHPGIIDAILSHNKLDQHDKIDAIDPAELATLLGADLLVYGEVVEWDRFYYLVESRVTVALQVRIVDGRSGETVFEAQQEESHTSGLRGGPTGYLSAATAPLLGLSMSHFIDLCNALSRLVTNPLVIQESPKFKGEQPPFIAAATHNGVGRTLRTGDVLKVYMVGSPAGRGFFRIGPAGPAVPMTEFGAGRYQGSHVVQQGDAFQNTVIEVHLVRAGRKTAADLEHAKIDIGG